MTHGNSRCRHHQDHPHLAVHRTVYVCASSCLLCLVHRHLRCPYRCHCPEKPVHGFSEQHGCPFCHLVQHGHVEPSSFQQRDAPLPKFLQLLRRQFQPPSICLTRHFELNPCNSVIMSFTVEFRMHSYSSPAKSPHLFI